MNKNQSAIDALEKLRKAMRPFWKERERIVKAECPQRIKELKKLNVIIEAIGGNCPVQAQGTVEGHRFYFRARGEHWSIEIAPADATGEYLNWCNLEGIWYFEEEYGTWPDAGWMHKHEALDFIKKAVLLWLESRK
jgi:hypothetical protein